MLRGAGHFEEEIKYSMRPLRGPLSDKISEIFKLKLVDEKGVVISKNARQLILAFQLIEGCVYGK